MTVLEKSDRRTQEISLDPKDWASLRQLGHRMLDDMFQMMETVHDRPIWQPMPASVQARLRAPLPWQAEGEEQAYRDFQEIVQPYPLGNAHGRFWSWVIGNGTPTGLLAEILTAGVNGNVFGANESAVRVEEQVIEWCKEFTGFPKAASGILVSGGSMANLVALAVARTAKGKSDIRKHGVASSPRPMTVYASTETHNSVKKAVELLGLGSENLRLVPVDDDFRISLPALEAAVSADRAAGYQPFCVVGNACTVNTGAVDDLRALAAIAKREDLWFHIDGAIGVPAMLSPRLKPLLAGLELADSTCFDFHKWMYLQYEAACVLIRDEGAHHGTFDYQASYLSKEERGVPAGSTRFSEYGIQLSRGFRALKIWMSFKAHGLERFARMTEQNVDQARYLTELIEADSSLQLMAPTFLNIVCYRFQPAGVADDTLDEVNREIVLRMQESGFAVPSLTVLKGRRVIRISNSNHRTRRADFELLVQKTLEIGRAILKEKGLPG